MAKQGCITFPRHSLNIYSFIQKVFIKHLECTRHYQKQSEFFGLKKERE